MIRMHSSRTVLGALVAGLLLGHHAGARADVDMTATWKVDVSAGPIMITTYETFAQTGSTLAMSRPADPPFEVPGSIDPVTGGFDLQFGPAMMDGVPEPGPDVVRTGTVAPDGLTFAAQQNLCIWDGSWGCLDIDMVGTRTDIVCGDEVVEGGEQCDLGDDNGGTCCNVACAFVDPDDDGTCAAEDNCPAHFNPAQEDWDDDGLGNPCDDTPEGDPSDPLELRTIRLATKPAATTSKLKLSGATAGPLGEPTFLRVTDAGGKSVIVSDLPGWATKLCTESAGLRLKCKSPDGLVLALKAKASAPSDLRVQLSIKTAPIGPPFVAPVTFTMLLVDGAHAGVLSNCKTSNAGSISCKP